ncbi:MAG: hypothetical protein HYV68_03135 [Candidatus Taylorbacteria bacterium]|nr:hypothetical protein [Candidatus Taylorbacteria bacterium]
MYLLVERNRTKDYFLKKYMILPLTKSAWEKGRVGPERWQDWYRGLIKALRIQDNLSPSRIVILSAVQEKGQPSEAENYCRVLERLEIGEDRYEVVRVGHDTISQMTWALREAKEKGEQLIVISTWLHYPRVRYLFRGKGAGHFAVFGIPRPYEAVTDIAMWLAMPIIDLLGQRERFSERSVGRW